MRKFVIATILFSGFLFSSPATAKRERFSCHIKMKGYEINVFESGRTENEVIRKLEERYKSGKVLYCKKVN